jgi:hypothetical protein
MKANVIRLLISVSIILIVLSCEKEVSNIDIPRVDPKPVIFCILNPGDTIIRLDLTYSASLYQDTTRPISRDALVFLSSEGKKVQMKLDTLYSSENYASFKLDSSQVRIMNGKTYHLEIRNKDLAVATAECTIPAAAVPPYGVKLEPISDLAIRYTVNIISNPFVNTYFDLHVKPFRIYQGDTVIGGFMPWGFGYDLFTNTGHSGAGFIQTGVVNADDATLSGFGDGYLGRLYVVDINYYNYHKAFQLLPHYNWEQTQEPAMMPTNITNGLGVFGAAVTK